MNREITHPEGIKEVNALEITQDIKDFITATSKDIMAEMGNIFAWQQKIDALIEFLTTHNCSCIHVSDNLS